MQVYKTGRHELLNEVEGTASVVYKDILDWIQQKLPWIVLGRVYTNPDKFLKQHFTRIRIDGALKHYGERFQKDSRLI